MKDANKFSNLSKKNNGLPKKNENISFGGDGCSEDGIPE